MFGTIKKWLGIESVKIELLLPEAIPKNSLKIVGKLRLSTLHSQSVSMVRIKIIEKYARGRGSDKLINEYELGSIELNKNFEVTENQATEIDFELPFTFIKSEIDTFGDKNAVTNGIVKAAKYLKAVQSEFRVEAEAAVKGTALNALDKKIIKII